MSTSTNFSSSTTSSILLRDASDWQAWFLVIKGRAEFDQIWKYCDPDLPSKPVLPSGGETPQHIQDWVTTGKTPDGETSQTMALFYNAHRAIAKEQDQKRAKIANLFTLIINTVPADNLPLSEDTKEPYSLLKKLKDRFQLND
ncbi:hypothetical protein M501DRAFT_806409 [Patellaria atrata CBS 101060]|uniref:Uncharacterized protein n=1 Tax=Patellaria atrata CBS 101060 TaxID=1346257 RepID=A0A9P4SD82_9PEZI|nr:hypothetical protein M501DRAFT_806409 [Patellaria atrata CBS 101060]